MLDNLPLSASLAQYAVIILICVSIVTRVSSSIAYSQNVNSTRAGRSPPTAPYWFPGIYHLFDLLSSPSTLLQKLIKNNSQHSPFYIRAGGTPILIVSDPAHVKSMFLASKQVTPKGFHMALYERVLGMPKEAVNLYAQDENTSEETRTVHTARKTLVRKYLSGDYMVDLTQVYIAALRKNLSRAGFKSGEWTEIEDLWALFRVMLPESIIEVILGSHILDMYPDLVQQFWAFDDNLQAFGENPIKPLLTLSPNAARDRILGSIKSWMSHSELQNPETEAIVKDSTWNTDTGSMLFRHRDSLFAGLPVVGVNGRASETLGIIQGGIANTMPSTFWYVFEALKDPELRQRLQRDIEISRTSTSPGWDIQKLCSRPLLQSMQSEITRIRMAAVVIRNVEVDDFLLNNTYSVPKGTLIFAFSKDAALNTAAWSKVRPSLTKKPLAEFWADRFLESNESKDGKKMNAEAVKYNADGLNALHFAFGGGQNLCPGKAWAKNVQIATLAVLLEDYEIELGGSLATDPSTVGRQDKIVGTIKPNGKIPIRIRPREKTA